MDIPRCSRPASRSSVTSDIARPIRCTRSASGQVWKTGKSMCPPRMRTAQPDPSRYGFDIATPPSVRAGRAGRDLCAATLVSGVACGDAVLYGGALAAAARSEGGNRLSDRDLRREMTDSVSDRRKKGRFRGLFWSWIALAIKHVSVVVEYSRTLNRLSSTMPKRPHRSPYRRAEQGHWYGPLMHADFPVRRRASSQLRE